MKMKVPVFIFSYVRQYEASTKLLLSRDAPANASKILEAEAHEFQDKNNRQALLLEVFWVHRLVVGTHRIQHVQHLSTLRGEPGWPSDLGFLLKLPARDRPLEDVLVLEMVS